MKTIKIYSTPICHYCQVAKDWFKENDIKYSEIDISKDEVGRILIQCKTGMMAVPVIQIDEEFIVGFDKRRIQELLEIKSS